MNSSLHLRTFQADQLGTGSFDGGRITEVKPIGFPGEPAALSRVGPLFYWAWATSHGDGLIGMHPHQSFEIVSYVVAGSIGHRDSLGNHTLVGAGGLQVMHAGSGISHEEETRGTGGSFLQIWFEPDLRAARSRPPFYQQLEPTDVPVRSGTGWIERVAVGQGSPARLTVDASIRELHLESGVGLKVPLVNGRSLAGLVIGGSGNIGQHQHELSRACFVSASADGDQAVDVEAGDEGLRIVWVEVPTRVPWNLYPKG